MSLTHRAQFTGALRRVLALVAVMLALTVMLPAGDPRALAASPEDETTTAEDEAVLLAAGNVGDCESDADEATGRLLDGLDGEILALGDLAYPDGSLDAYERCFLPAWGHLLDRTRGVAGNIDYGTDGATGFFATFPEAAGPQGRGYYSFDAGAWHVVVLNTNCAEVQGCGPGSPQLAWLRADLAANGAACTLAVGHHPRFSSGAEVGSTGEVAPLWDALQEHGTDVIISAHSHHYERFVRQTSDGVPDPRGPRLFVVGTGGRLPHDVGTRLATSEVAAGLVHGALELRLRASDFSWRFVPAEGTSFTDEGREDCLTLRPGLAGQVRAAAPVFLFVLPLGLVLLAVVLRPPWVRVR
jgi:acid phosphatase type 7